MQSPPQILHHLAGTPPLEDEQERTETCLVCGFASPVVLPEKKAIPRTDTDRDVFRAPWSDWVCTACKWCSQGRPPDTLRLWSIFWREDGFDEFPLSFADYMAEKVPQYEMKGKSISVASLVGAVQRGDLVMTNKGDMRPLVRLLADPPDCPWFASIADSGQVHTVRFARINHGRRWTVRFERADVVSTSDEWAVLSYHVSALKLAEFRDDEILTGNPNPYSLKRAGVDVWRRHAEPIRRHARSELLELALFCMTKDTTHEHHRFTAEKIGATDTTEPGRGHPDGRARQHPAGGEGEQRKELLAVGTELHGGRGREGPDAGEVHLGTDRADVEEVRRSNSAAEKRRTVPEQLGLFSPE